MNQPLVSPPSHDVHSDLAELAQFFNETLGFCPNSVLTMQRRSNIANAFINLNKAVMENHGNVNSSLKRLIGYVSSYTAGCQYCQAHTIRAAERYGSEKEKLENIWDYKTHPAFSSQERAVLDFSVAASSIPNQVDNKIVANLKRYWTDDDIIEILGVISLFGYLNRWNDSMATELEPEAIASGEKYLVKNDWSGGKHLHNTGRSDE